MFLYCVFVFLIALGEATLYDSCSGSSADYKPIETITEQCYQSANGAQCKNQCGRITKKGRFMWSADYTCSCDDLCVHYHDCCPDYYEQCANGTKFTDEYPSTTCLLASTGKSNEHWNTIVVSDCPTDYKDEEIIGNCRNTNGSLFTRVPVRDNITNIQYRNRFCAICNNVTQYKFWRFDLSCEANATDKVRGTLEEFLSRLDHPKCNFTFYDPAQQYRFCVLGSITTCKRGCKNQALIDKCHRSQTLFTYRGSKTAFKNAYCAICHGNNDIANADLKCSSRKFPEDGPGMVAGDSNLWKFSFSLLLDVNSAGGVNVGLKSSLTSNNDASAAACAPGNLRDCVFKSCQKGYELKNGVCVPGYILSDVQVEISYIPIDARFTFTDVYFTNYVETILYEEGLNRVFKINMRPDVTRSKFNESIGNNLVVLGVTVVATFSQKLLANCDANEEGRRIQSSKELLKASLKALFIRKTIGWVKSVDINTNERLSCSQNGTNSSCYVTEVYNGTFEIRKGGSVWLSDRNQTLEPGEYRLFNDTVLICGEKERNKEFIPQVMISSALGIVTIVCLVISEVCLLVRLVLQFCVPFYRTFPAKLQFCLIVTLFVGGLVFLLRPVVAESHGLCFAFGVLAHAAYLSVFVWMNLIAIDTWNTFSPKSLLKTRSTGKRLLAFCLCGWLVPAVVVAFSIVLEFLDIDEDFKPQYTRNGVCWITRKYALLVMFAAPLALIVLTNIVIFILTAVTLHRAMKFSHSTSSSKTTEKDEFVMYVKLFVLLGVTWVFGFLAMLVNHEAFWYIFIILNASQGAFVVITTVLTKRVRASFRRRDTPGNTVVTSRSVVQTSENCSTVSKLAQSAIANNGYDHETKTPMDGTVKSKENTRM